MAHLRDMEVVWDDLLEAFMNSEENIVYFLDRETGEVFFVPFEYQDEEFWKEIEAEPDRYPQIPGYDYEQERLLLHEFIRGIADEELKNVLERAFTGKAPCGKIDEILSFYPDESEQLMAIRDEMVSDRIRRWLEEHDLYFQEEELF